MTGELLKPRYNTLCKVIWKRQPWISSWVLRIRLSELESIIATEYMVRYYTEHHKVVGMREDEVLNWWYVYAQTKVA